MPAARAELEARPFEPVTQGVLGTAPRSRRRGCRDPARARLQGSVDLVKRRPRELRPPAERPAQRSGFRAPAGPCSWTGGSRPPSQIAGRKRRVYALVSSPPYSGRAVGALLAPAYARGVSEGVTCACATGAAGHARVVYGPCAGWWPGLETSRTWNPRFLHLRGQSAAPHYRLHAPTRARRARSTARCAISVKALAGKANRLARRSRCEQYHAARPGLHPPLARQGALPGARAPGRGTPRAATTAAGRCDARESRCRSMAACTTGVLLRAPEALVHLRVTLRPTATASGPATAAPRGHARCARLRARPLVAPAPRLAGSLHRHLRR
jgi:hypothetical protein